MYTQGLILSSTVWIFFALILTFKKKCYILSTLIMEVLDAPSNCAPQVSASLTSPKGPEDAASF